MLEYPTCCPTNNLHTLWEVAYYHLEALVVARLVWIRPGIALEILQRLYRAAVLILPATLGMGLFLNTTDSSWSWR